MNNPCRYWKDKLLAYTEAQAGRSDGISEGDFQAVQNHVKECEHCRNEVQRIAAHLRFLEGVSSPTIPSSLASRCLNPERKKARYSTVRLLQWGSALSTIAVVLIIFSAGVWFGKSATDPVLTDTEDKFITLLAVQNELMDKLENLYITRVSTDSHSTSLPYQFVELKYTSEIIKEYYNETQSNYVARRGLQAAILRNIFLLQSLCNYFEENPDGSIQDWQHQKNETPIKM